jgi:hypothetical protein
MAKIGTRGAATLSTAWADCSASPSGVKQAATGRYNTSPIGKRELRCRLARKGRENASVRDGRRRRRSSPTPSCNGKDTVKVRQGKLHKMHANGRGRESRCWQAAMRPAGAPCCRQRQVRSGRVLQSNWKAECRETGLLRVRREARCGIPAGSRRN